MPKLQIILDILNERNIPVKSFCEEINMSISGFKRIIERNSTRIQTLETIAEVLNCPVSLFFNEPLPEKETLSQTFVPHIPYTAQAGSLSGFSLGVTENNCDLNTKITSLGNYDFTIDVNGDSMIPEFHSGNTIACKRLEASDPIRYGSVYLLDTAQGIILKKVEKDKTDISGIRCISLNSQYEPFTLALADIYSMSVVVGIIKSL
ncbi:MAG: S24 family peptidase [Bacteroidales bacterium]